MRLQPPSCAATSLLLLLPILISASPLTTTINEQSTQPTPTPTSSPSPALDPSRWHPVSTLLPSSSDAPQLDLREIVNQPAAAQPALNPTQVSPVTTLMLWQTVAPGAPAQQVQVVYSQAFEEVPDQWELPVVGSIGLGTIKGTVGVVKTNNKVKRGIVAWPTTMPEAPKKGSFLQVEKVEKREPEPEAEPEPAAFVILPPGNDEAAIVARAEQQGLEKRKGKSGGGSGGSSSASGRVKLDAGPATLALLIALVTGMVL